MKTAKNQILSNSGDVTPSQFAVSLSTVDRRPRAIRRWRSKARAILLGAALLGMSLGAAHADRSITLAWNPSTTPSVAGYYVIAVEQNTATTNRIDVGAATQATLSYLKEGLRYVFTVVAYDAARAESAPSDAASFAVPVPLNLLPAVAGNGPLRLQFPASPGLSYQLEASSDLKTWTTLWQPGLVTAYTTLEFSDPQSSALPQRFYRLKVN